MRPSSFSFVLAIARAPIAPMRPKKEIKRGKENDVCAATPQNPESWPYDLQKVEIRESGQQSLRPRVSVFAVRRICAIFAPLANSHCSGSQWRKYHFSAFFLFRIAGARLPFHLRLSGEREKNDFPQQTDSPKREKRFLRIDLFCSKAIDVTPFAACVNALRAPPRSAFTGLFHFVANDFPTLNFGSRLHFVRKMRKKNNVFFLRNDFFWNCVASDFAILL